LRKLTPLLSRFPQFVYSAIRRFIVWLPKYHHEFSVGLFAGLILLTQVGQAAVAQVHASQPLTSSDNQQAMLIMQRYVNPDSLATSTDSVTLASVAFSTDNIGGQDEDAEPVIPDTSPYTHTVTVHENIWSIANKYSISIDTLVKANPSLADSHFLHIGDQLTIPAKITPKKTTYRTTYASVVSPGAAHQEGDPIFEMPVNYTYISQFFSAAVHPAYDLPAPVGADVRATHDGVIIAITNGYAGGWGNSVLEDIGNGFTARSAHLSAFAPGIHVGSYVSAGEVIGLVGNTGHSTGPHVHFEVRKNGLPYDPFLLKP
jgi:murein DD-endopeptidase MepM/ murein hydrolase activator NlpD